MSSLIAQTFGTPTLTYSGQPTQWQSYWNTEVEQRFVKLGGVELNARLGYVD